MAGGGAGGTSSTFGAAFPGTGTAAGFRDSGGDMAAGNLDASGNLKVNVAAGSGSNPAAGATGAAVPGSADYQGINVAGNLQGAAGFDLDTGAGSEHVQGVSLRKAANGGSVELGTASNPIRTEPTGGTTQPASIADGADAALGTTTDAAVQTDSAGTISGKLRGLIKFLADILKIQGAAAADAAPAGNPLRSGALGRTTTPTPVTAGRMVDILADRFGRLFRVSPICSRASSAGTSITTATDTLVVAAPGSGNHLRYHRLWAQNSAATGTWCFWGDGSGVKTIPFFLAQNQPFSMQMDGRWEGSSNTGLYLKTMTGGANIEWYVEYETLPD